MFWRAAILDRPAKEMRESRAEWVVGWWWRGWKHEERELFYLGSLLLNLGMKYAN